MGLLPSFFAKINESTRYAYNPLCCEGHKKHPEYLAERLDVYFMSPERCIATFYMV